MTRSCRKSFLWVVVGLLVMGISRTATPADGPPPEVSSAPMTPSRTTSEEMAVNPKTLNMGSYYEEQVDNFVVVFDASTSKHLPSAQQTKLKEIKDLLRRFNQKTPSRPLFGGLRRYGWEAGAFTEPTSLLFGMTNYDRPGYADAIEKVRWAGGKTPMANVIDKASDDLSLAPTGPKDYLAMVIFSDGKVVTDDPDPVMAARRAKERYGDRICIYTVAVGDDLPFEKYTPEHMKPKYREKFRLLLDIAKEGKCGYMITAPDLLPDKNMAQFAHDVFHRGHSFECPDSDGDGVCDADDRCPGTPKGAPVDEYGCWNIGKVQFDLNKWNIKPEYHAMLDDIARVLNLNPDVQLAVQGHTCTIWTEEYNMKLSQWRAMAVASYLTNRGVNPNQLAVEGYGFKSPTASNDTDGGRVLNRRVEFKRLR